MSSRTLPFVVPALGALLICALSFLNTTQVAFSLFGATAYLPVGVLLGVGYGLGMLLTIPLYWARLRSEQASTKALGKWETEDQKLLQQVQTDREKQLEAKIATLEAALQKALKKS